MEDKMLPGQPVAIKDSQVSKQQKRIEDNLDDLSMSIANLEARLERVLLPEKPIENPGKPEKPEKLEEMVSLAMDLDNYSRIISSKVIEVRRIIERLEL